MMGLVAITRCAMLADCMVRGLWQVCEAVEGGSVAERDKETHVHTL